MAASQTEDIWTPRLEKERAFNAKKDVRNKAELFLEGGALPSERRELSALAGAHKARRAKAIKQRQRADKRKADIMAPIQSIAFRGKPVYVDPSARPFAPSEMAKVIMKNRMTIVEEVVLAPGGVFIVDAPARLPRSVRWAAVLSGAAAVCKDYFASATAHGNCMSWLSAISTRRLIWLSADAKAAEPLLAELIAWACRLPANKWKLQATWDEDTYVVQQRRVANLLGVVAAAEKLDAKFGHKKTLVYEDFLKYVEKFDPSVSGFKSEVEQARFSS